MALPCARSLLALVEDVFGLPAQDGQRLEHGGLGPILDRLAPLDPDRLARVRLRVREQRIHRLQHRDRGLGRHPVQAAHQREVDWEKHLGSSPAASVDSSVSATEAVTTAAKPEIERRIERAEAPLEKYAWEAIVASMHVLIGQHRQPASAPPIHLESRQPVAVSADWKRHVHV